MTPVDPLSQTDPRHALHGDRCRESTHFDVLDGLRGVAAYCVLLVHCFSRDWVPNGFLGVDLFFMLSGFVIAHSYRQRLLDGMAMGDFLRRRFVRLYPMVFIGVLLGLAAAVLGLLANLPGEIQGAGFVPVAALFVGIVTLAVNAVPGGWERRLCAFLGLTRTRCTCCTDPFSTSSLASEIGSAPRVRGLFGHRACHRAVEHGDVVCGRAAGGTAGETLLVPPLLVAGHPIVIDRGGLRSEPQPLESAVHACTHPPGGDDVRYSALEQA